MKYAVVFVWILAAMLLVSHRVIAASPAGYEPYVFDNWSGQGLESCPTDQKCI